jgi:predicted nicotinamide N-methyase
MIEMAEQLDFGCTRVGVQSWYKWVVTTPSLATSIGDFPLQEYCLRSGDRAWTFLHTGAIVTVEQEGQYLTRERDRLPYGVMLWPASIALAHDVLARAGHLRGKRVLELGAGTGIPGIIAGSLGARVVQVDRSDVALHVCRLNIERNCTQGVELQKSDWNQFHSDEQFDLILGADVLYAASMHDRLREICDQCLAPEGTVLFADPLRAESLSMLGAMETSGWRVSLAKWTIEIAAGPRTIAIYEATRASS